MVGVQDRDVRVSNLTWFSLVRSFIGNPYLEMVLDGGILTHIGKIVDVDDPSV